jgi:hypothetical protein
MGNSYQEICDATGWTYTKVNRCLAEGRKSFLARYAGIEAGEECRRWAPVLSAMVDGEATTEQVLEVRPHLRNCAGCRSALRELRGSNAPLAALFPAGGVAFLGGEGGFDGAGDMLSRLWGALWGELSDRAATTALRAQSMAQAILPGKSMAIAASVAALAGGGFALDEAVLEAPRTALHVPTVSAAADRLTTSNVTPLVRPTTATTAAQRPARARTARRTPKRRPRVRRRRAASAVVRAPRARTVVAPAPPATAIARARAGARAARATPRPATPAPRAAAPRAPARPRTGVPAEFGLETR